MKRVILYLARSYCIFFATTSGGRSAHFKQLRRSGRGGTGWFFMCRRYVDYVPWLWQLALCYIKLLRFIFINWFKIMWYYFEYFFLISGKANDDKMTEILVGTLFNSSNELRETLHSQVIFFSFYVCWCSSSFKHIVSLLKSTFHFKTAYDVSLHNTFVTYTWHTPCIQILFREIIRLVKIKVFHWNFGAKCSHIFYAELFHHQSIDHCMEPQLNHNEKHIINNKSYELTELTLEIFRGGWWRLDLSVYLSDFVGTCMISLN